MTSRATPTATRHFKGQHIQLVRNQEFKGRIVQNSWSAESYRSKSEKYSFESGKWFTGSVNTIPYPNEVGKHVHGLLKNFEGLYSKR